MRLPKGLAGLAALRRRTAREAGTGASQDADPTEDAAPARRSTFRALRHRNFRLFFLGQAISLPGTWMQTIAQAWLVLEITDSKAALGLTVFLQFIPVTIFTLFAGVIVDRAPKRDFILMAQVLAMAQALALTVLVWSGQVEIWHVYILAVVLGLANAVDFPSRQAFVVEMVGKDDIMNAMSMVAGIFNTARLIGPALGGVVIAVVGLKVAFLINAVSFVPVIGALLAIDTKGLHREVRHADGPLDLMGELREGLAFALRTPATLVVIIGIASVGTFGFNYVVILPLVAKYLLNGGSEQLGFLTAATGFGALISALALAGRARPTKHILYAGGFVFSAMFGGMALSGWFPATLLILVGMGTAATAFTLTANTSIQLATPDHLRGRVMALYVLLLAGSTPFGAYFSGFLAEEISVRAAIYINGALCGAGVAASLLYYLTHREAVRQTEHAGGFAEARTHAV